MYFVIVDSLNPLNISQNPKKNSFNAMGGAKYIIACIKDILLKTPKLYIPIIAALSNKRAARNPQMEIALGTSFDLYKNYIERGEHFKKLIIDV